MMPTDNQWNPETLFKFVEAIFAELRSHVDQLFRVLTETMDQRFEASADAAKTALVAAKQATDKAEAATNMRLEGMNEFWAQLKDQTAAFIPRIEALALVTAEADARLAHSKVVDGKVEALVGTVRTYIDTQAGRGAGLSFGWKVGIGALGALLTILSITAIIIQLAGS